MGAAVAATRDSRLDIAKTPHERDMLTEMESMVEFKVEQNGASVGKWAGASSKSVNKGLNFIELS